MLSKPICPYCMSEATIVGGAIIYPHREDLYPLRFWVCSGSELNPHTLSYVGCHKGTENPLGRLANRELREWKKKAHAAFDPLWKGGVFDSRNGAYRWLANTLNISSEDCHIGLFDIKMCQRVVNLCKKYDSRS